MQEISHPCHDHTAIPRTSTRPNEPLQQSRLLAGRAIPLTRQFTITAIMVLLQSPLVISKFLSKLDRTMTTVIPEIK